MRQHCVFREWHFWGWIAKLDALQGFVSNFFHTEEDCLSWLLSPWLADEKNFPILLISWQPCQNKALKSHSALPNLSGASLCKKSITTSDTGIESLEENKLAFSIWFTCALESIASLLQPKAVWQEGCCSVQRFWRFPEEYRIHFPKDRAVWLVPVNVQFITRWHFISVNIKLFIVYLFLQIAFWICCFHDACVIAVFPSFPCTLQVGLLATRWCSCWVQVCGFDQPWSHVLLGLHYSAAVHDPRGQTSNFHCKGECGAGIEIYIQNRWNIRILKKNTDLLLSLTSRWRIFLQHLDWVLCSWILLLVSEEIFFLNISCGRFLRWHGNKMF